MEQLNVFRLLDLPQELIVELLSHLDYESLLKCCAVCYVPTLYEYTKYSKHIRLAAFSEKFIPTFLSSKPLLN